ncbi:MAG TPA: ABC transporter permease [Devosia sp.]|nr:ABC transporter permease [Devosia sp.]
MTIAEIARPRSTRHPKVRSRRQGLPWFAIIVLGLTVFAAAFAHLLSPYDPNIMSLGSRLKPPGWIGPDGLHLLGTDSIGRDLFTRICYGARVSLLVAGIGVVFGGGMGLIVGIVAGYLGGRIDSVLMRLTDVFMALPSLLIALVFVMTVGPGLVTTIVALSIISWSRFARIIRSEVLSLKERDYVLLARVAGCSPLRVMAVHILPNVTNTFVILCSLQVSELVLTESTLSFLGAGVPPPTPTWGNMAADGRDFLSNAWWISVAPGLALALVVYSFNAFGDWLRDKLDPRLKQTR